jgi:hypothetical protein
MGAELAVKHTTSVRDAAINVRSESSDVRGMMSEIGKNKSLP